MTSDDAPKQPRRTARSDSAEAGRKERLAAALRANLRRRKAQSRGRAERPADGNAPREGGGPDGA